MTAPACRRNRAERGEEKGSDPFYSALKDTDMARDQIGTIRLRLLKIGVVVSRNTRRVSRHLSTACLDKVLFQRVAARLEPG
ncbi:MAG: transposase [Alphaproteobacteria bacterium]